MNPRQLYARILRGDVQNVDFDDFARLVRAFGFSYDHARGSHQVFRHAGGARLVLQPRRNQAKPYQIQQFLELVESDGLDWE